MPSWFPSQCRAVVFAFRSSISMFIERDRVAPPRSAADCREDSFASGTSQSSKSASSSKQITFAGEVRPLNVLPQESSTTLKEPLGVVYSENLADSSSKGSSASSGENAHITRQLAEGFYFTLIFILSAGLWFLFYSYFHFECWVMVQYEQRKKGEAKSSVGRDKVSTTTRWRTMWILCNAVHERYY